MLNRFTIDDGLIIKRPLHQFRRGCEPGESDFDGLDGYWVLCWLVDQQGSVHTASNSDPIMTKY